MKKTITFLTLSTFLFLSCGKDKKEINNSEPAINVKVSAIATDNNSEFVTASGKLKPKTVPMFPLE